MMPQKVKKAFLKKELLKKGKKYVNKWTFGGGSSTLNYPWQHACMHITCTSKQYLKVNLIFRIVFSFFYFALLSEGQPSEESVFPKSFPFLSQTLQFK